MGFATLCSFGKLFVSSGVTKYEDAVKQETLRPDFYIPSLGDLLPFLKSLKNLDSL